MHGVITGLKIKLHYSPNLYVGEGISPTKLESFKARLYRRPLLTNACLVVFPENAFDQLEIIAVRQLTQKFYENREMRVVGLAKNKDDAVSLIVKMTEDCLADRKDCLLKEFLAWQ